MSIQVKLEPPEFKHCEPENCIDCRMPTRYWLPDGHTPLCPSCAERRNKSEAEHRAQELTVEAQAVDAAMNYVGLHEHMHGDGRLERAYREGWLDGWKACLQQYAQKTKT